MNEQASPLYNLTLLFLSVYVLAVLIVEAIFVSDPEVKRVLQYIDLAVCSVFLMDFLRNLWMADSKLGYLKWGWIDLAASIPAVDPLRWGRVTRIVRILRYLRAIKSIRVLMASIAASKFETLTWCVFLVIFLSFTLCSAFILEFEKLRGGSNINSAEAAIWWAFLNLMNAKAGIEQAISPEGAVMTTFLNKIGLLLFAYLNSMIVAWLVVQRREPSQDEAQATYGDDV